MSKIVKLFFVSLLVLAFSAIAFAQSTTTGSIGGVVTNPAKEVVPGATVTVKNAGTNKEDTATTDDSGRFKVANLTTRTLFRDGELNRFQSDDARQCRGRNRTRDGS